MPLNSLSLITPTALDAFDFLELVPHVRQIQNNPIVERMRQAVKFDHISVSGLDMDRYRYGSGFSVDTDFPSQFVERYMAQSLHLEDPLILASRESLGVVIEADVYATNAPSEQLTSLTQAFCIHNRTIFPVRRQNSLYGAVCLCRATSFTQDEIDFVSLFSETLHTAITKPIMEKFASMELRLTKGEMSCLTQASYGLTSEVVALRTGYKNDTVNSYLKSAVKKLGATNRTHAVADAIRRKLIT